MARIGRPRALDDAKRRDICALLTAGYSLAAAAADYVSCSTRTILRKIDQNPEFAEKVRRANVVGELDPLSTLRKAARSDWRAAAWYLERINPQRFGKRNPVLMKPEEIMQTIDGFAEVIMTEVTDEEVRERIMQKILAAAHLIEQSAADHENLVGTAKPISLSDSKEGEAPHWPSPDDVLEMVQSENLNPRDF